MSQSRATPPTSTPMWQQRQALWGKEANPHAVASELSLKELFPDIICRSKIMHDLLGNVYKIARSQSAVLILGESGTGKELIASAIHRLSPRASQCFMAINCSAIPETLLEAELFGYERGAFTGAERKRIGHFAAANNGSVFLDEIGDMPLSLQAKLLRVLQEKKFSPVGSREAVEADIRIIAATNVDLEKAVQHQNFRLDLYYRLNVLPIKIPPLRERKEDISLLLDYFIEQSNRLHPHNTPSWFDAEAKELLCNYDWPGNIRQLQNLVERLAIIQGGGRLGISALPSEFTQQLCTPSLKTPCVHSHRSEREPECDRLEAYHSNLEPRATAESASPAKEEVGPLPLAPELGPCLSLAGLDLTLYVERLENNLINQALKLTNNNKNQAAKLLGLNRTTLVERIKRRGLRSQG